VSKSVSTSVFVCLCVCVCVCVCLSSSMLFVRGSVLSNSLTFCYLRSLCHKFLCGVDQHQ
jgi:hypothetical protein